jgi:hypothetical protein
MEEPNKFHTLGKCELCGHISNLEKDGCNFLLTIGVEGDASR